MDSLSSSDSPLKHCTGPCGRDLPATPEFFHRDKRTPDKLTYQCKECRTAHTSAYNKEHQDWRDAYNKQYYAEHSSEEQERCAAYRGDPEHKSRMNENSLAWYWSDVENNREHARRYSKTPRGRVVARAGSHRRRARKIEAGGSYTADELLDQLKRQKGRCYYCRAKIGKTYHADHVVPLARGGSNDISNIVIACPSCNWSKHDKLPHEWPKGGRLL